MRLDKSNDDDSDTPPPSLPDTDDLELTLSSHLDDLSSSLSPLSASGSPLALFESVNVSLYGEGSSAPLGSVAQLTSQDDSVVLAAFDPSTVKDLASQIAASKVLEESVGSLNPAADESKGTVVVRIPRMNAERREKLAGLAKKHSGKFTKGIRGARKAFMDEAKKAVKGGVSKDEGKVSRKSGVYRRCCSR